MVPKLSCTTATMSSVYYSESLVSEPAHGVWGVPVLIQSQLPEHTLSRFLNIIGSLLMTLHGLLMGIPRVLGATDLSPYMHPVKTVSTRLNLRMILVTSRRCQ